MPDSLHASVFAWFETNARCMPFRDTRDPYAIWVSEVMLQQTTVATVTPYWQRFVERFPTVEALAHADEEDVLRAWAGLGYYSRARNLRRAAGLIVERHGARFPERLEDALALPGVGRYTACAVLSLAHNLDLPVVDANVARVLARVFAIEGDPKSGPAHRALWQAAESILPRGRARDWNLALFDIGATLCAPAAPRCLACPLAEWCEARRRGRQEDYPQRTPKPPMTERTDVCAALRDADGRLLLRRRPPNGVWAGMWEMPRVTLANGETPEAAVARIGRELQGITLTPVRERTTVRHTVMRERITLRVWEVSLAGGVSPVEGPDLRWVAPGDLHRLPMPSPQRKAAGSGTAAF
jgi:A/G-specific adenine glycosylase